MDQVSRIAMAISAVGVLTWLTTWFQFAMFVYAFTTLLIAAGLGLAAYDRVRPGLALAAAASGTWIIGFTISGFEFLSILAAAFLAIGFALAAAMGDGPGALAPGLSIAFFGNLWYTLHNTFLGGTTSFALGNWIVTAGLGVIIWRSVQSTPRAPIASG